MGSRCAKPVIARGDAGRSPRPSAGRRCEILPAEAAEGDHAASGRRLSDGEMARRRRVQSLAALQRDAENGRGGFRLIGTLETAHRQGRMERGRWHGRAPLLRKIETLAQSLCSAGAEAWTTEGSRVKKGVRQIVRLDDAVAAAADHMGAVKGGRRRRRSCGTTGSAYVPQHEDIALLNLRQVMLKPCGRPGHRRCRAGDGALRDEGRGDRPASSLMPRSADEPGCAFPRQRSGQIWSDPGDRARAGDGGKAAGCRLDKLIISNHLIGGGLAAAGSRRRAARGRDRETG